MSTMMIQLSEIKESAPTEAAQAAPKKTYSAAHRWACFAYGSVVYTMFLGCFLYLVGFIADAFVPKGIDDGVAGPLGPALLINASMLLAFAIQHTIMARPAFKARWTKIIPEAIERSTFVLVTVMLLSFMAWQWRPLPDLIWNVEAPLLRGALYTLSAAGWATVLISTFSIDHFDLFGLRQVWLHLRGRERREKPFTTRGLYSVVRHPLMVGFLVAFWATPSMSVGHLFFAILVTGYVLIGIRIEEKDLVKILGQDYVNYRKKTRALIPIRK